MEEQIYDFKLIPTYQRYYSNETNYGAYMFKTKDDIPHVEKNDFDNKGEAFGTIAGSMQQLTEGIEYDAQAKLVFNKKYKQWQYEPISVVAPAPTTLETQQQFLEALITPNQSKVLLEAYPNIVTDVMEGKEIDLSKTKGIKEKTFNLIKEKILSNYVIADILCLLKPLGVTMNMIKKLVSNEPNPVLLKKKLKNNPYILTRIHGLGFLKVDNLALKISPELRHSEIRVVAFINYHFESVGNDEGHTWIYKSDLDNAVRQTIGDCFDIYQKVLDQEIEKSTFLHIDDNKIGLKKYYRIEDRIYKLLHKLNEAEPFTKNVDIRNGIRQSENKLGFTLTDEQTSSVLSIEDNNVVIITAPAGCGKTIIANVILDAYEKDARIAMAALSAKAAQRLKEATGRDAQTIHKLLGFKNGDFEHDEENPLNADVFVIDEASMINEVIFLNLLKAIPLGSKLIIVFDYAQLPPIGVGNVASDLLHSGEIAINILTKIHRQAEKSGILVDANKIRKGINPLEKPEALVIHGELQDMYYKFRESREALRDLAVKAFMKSLEDEDIEDIIMIVPRKKDCVNSARELNNIIQDLVIPSGKVHLKRGDTVFKLGAKVIQKVNDYDRNVTNGEIGYIINIDMKKGEYIVRYGDKLVEYDRANLIDMELAYALTVHSSQGSQWKTVITVLDMTSYKLLDSTLLYTAITRASKRCMVIAEPKAYIKCIRDNKAKIRQTYLKDMVKQVS